MNNILFEFLLTYRFWGKIFGKSKNYWIVEADLQEEELARRIQVKIYFTIHHWLQIIKRKLSLLIPGLKTPSALIQEGEVADQAKREREESDAEVAAKAAEDEAAEKKAQEEATKEAADATFGAGVQSENEVEKKKELVLNFPPIPETHWKPPAEVPLERIGTGVNKKVILALFHNPRFPTPQWSSEVLKRCDSVFYRIDRPTSCADRLASTNGSNCPL